MSAEEVQLDRYSKFRQLGMWEEFLVAGGKNKEAREALQTGAAGGCGTRVVVWRVVATVWRMVLGVSCGVKHGVTCMCRRVWCVCHDTWCDAWCADTPHLPAPRSPGRHHGGGHVGSHRR